MADFHLIYSQIDWKRPQIAEISHFIMKSVSRNQMVLSEFSLEAHKQLFPRMHSENVDTNGPKFSQITKIWNC